jgi:hypothetical protein
MKNDHGYLATSKESFGGLMIDPMLKVGTRRFGSMLWGANIIVSGCLLYAPEKAA